jgi:hypothetical protein
MVTGTGNPKVKGPLSWQAFLFNTTLLFVGAALGFSTNYILQIMTKETKTIMASISSSDNLAELPIDSEDSLEIFLTLPNNHKLPIRSLFRYEASTKNTSEQGIDDFTVLINMPKDAPVVLMQSSITSQPPELIDVTDIVLIDTASPKIGTVSPRQQEYRVSLLNPNQSITFSYYAYATNTVSPPSMDVLVQKKDWIQTAGAPISPPITERDDAFYYVLVAFVTGFLVYPAFGLMFLLLNILRRY